MFDITEAAAEWIVDSSYADIPEPVRDEIQTSILDSIGCALRGTHEPPVKTLRGLVKEWDTNPACTIWGTADRAAVPFAAAINAMATHQWDYDDTMLGMFHPASVTVPPAMAIAETRQVDGEAFIDAVTTGYEVINAIGWAANPRELVDSGFYNSIIAIFGPTAVAATLLELDYGKTTRALGIAATHAAGLYSGTEAKRLNGPAAVRNGLIAARLANRGFEAPTDGLEATYSGFLTTFADDPTPAEILDRLGTYDFTIFRKLYPCIRSNHPAVACVAEIAGDQDGLEPDTIDEIVVRADRSTVNYTVNTPGGGHEVRTPGNAKISLPYCVAATLIHGTLTPEQFTEPAIGDPAVQSLLKRVAVEIEPAYDDLSYEDRYRCHMTVRLRDGTTFEREYRSPPGDPENRMTADQLHDKFWTNATFALSQDGASAVLETGSRLRTVQSMDRFAALLVPDSGN